MRVLKICLIVLVLAVLNVSAQLFQNEPDKIKVTIAITSDNKELKNQLYSYASRELRSLRDVEIVENDAFYQIKLGFIILPTSIVNEKAEAFAMSLVVTRVYLCKPMTKDDKRDFIAYEQILDSSLFTGEVSNLQRISAGAITDFDAEILKKERRNRAKAAKEDWKFPTL